MTNIFCRSQTVCVDSPNVIVLRNKKLSGRVVMDNKCVVQIRHKLSICFLVQLTEASRVILVTSSNSKS